MALTLSDPGEGDSYVRGGAGFAVGGRTILGLGAVAVLVSVTALTIALFVSAANANSIEARLKAHGVAVPARVTGCLGIATGTGITVLGYACHVTVVVDGHRYADQLKGTSRRYAVGDVVAAVVDPATPSVVFAAAAVDDASGSSTAYEKAFAWLAVLLALSTATAWWWRKAQAAASRARKPV